MKDHFVREQNNYNFHNINVECVTKYYVTSFGFSFQKKILPLRESVDLIRRFAGRDHNLNQFLNQLTKH